MINSCQHAIWFNITYVVLFEYYGIYLKLKKSSKAVIFYYGLKQFTLNVFSSKSWIINFKKYGLL